MQRPRHTFKIGEQVYHYSGGLPGRKRTGPYTVVGRVRQSDGTILYRIKNSMREQLAHPSELKLVVARARKAADG
jgi:hypothetical protein